MSHLFLMASADLRLEAVNGHQIRFFAAELIP